ncbi:cytochrome P450 2U1-like [Littorina saxatilis]|uniref:Cytochrome P450 n=1 Tax=Littorina saxatilis TaxID=31220 RepID=A0AAN9BSE3_9CAEN
MFDVILVAFIVFLACHWYCDYRSSNLPPGPPSLPLIGHLPLLDQDPRAQFVTWRRQYGDVFSLYLGSRLVVVLNGYDVIKDALVKHADIFSVRPKMFITDLITQRGIVFNSGPSWKEQRKVSIQILRSLGMGRQRFADNMLAEVSEFVKAVGKKQGQATDLSKVIIVSMSNNICSVIFGRRFDYDFPNFLRYLDLIQENFHHLRSTNLVNYLPWLRFLPGDLFKAKKILHNVQEMNKCFLIPQIQRHIDNQNGGDDTDNEESDDFISAYLKQIRKEKATGNAPSTVNEENLLWVVSDLFVAGTETLTSTLLWIILYLIHNPKVQDKCFKEISDVIGRTSPPSLRHRQDMTYVQATILETLRIADVGGMGLQHGVLRTAEFRGCTIPRDAIVLPILHSALHDSAVWGDPENFRPERFLDSAGGLVKKAEFIPFSLGRRQCPGEGIARQQLFFYVTSLIQHFRFLPAEDGQLPSLDGIQGFTFSPAPFCLRAVPRDDQA